MTKFFYFILIALLGIHFTHDEGLAQVDKSTECEKLVTPPKEPILLINGSGFVDYDQQVYEDAKIISKVAQELGYSTPPHQMNIMPSDQLNLSVAGHGHPAPHWVEGLELLRAAEQTRGVLEYVTPGCPVCRANYSASSTINEQRSIIMHVIGHNDFSNTHLFELIRKSDSATAAYQLSRSVGEAYVKNDHDEVALWYQWIQSLGNLQDYNFATFEPPEKFDPHRTIVDDIGAQKPNFWDPGKAPSNMLEELNKVRDLKRARSENDSIFGTEFELADSKRSSASNKKIRSLPWQSTQSVLQAFVKNLPEGSPAWQKDILALYEARQRTYPSIFNTETVNEGWATFAMYVIAKHLPPHMQGLKERFDYAQLVSAATSASFTNPYWMGLTGWYNLYTQFLEKDEIKKLSDERAKDRAFILWARDFFHNKTDMEWARFAFDDKWIQKLNLFLMREVDFQLDGFNPNIPYEKQKYIVLSRNSIRIRNFLIRKYIQNKYYAIVPFSFVNPEISRGYIQLNQIDTDDLPIEPLSAGKTMFVISQVMGKPVRVNALLSSAHLEKEVLKRFPKIYPFDRMGGSFALGSIQEKLERLQTNWTTKVQITVYPNGQVELVKNEANDKLDQEDQAIQDLVKKMTRSIEAYRTDVLASYNDDVQEWQLKQWAKLSAQVSDSNVQNTLDLVQYNPRLNGAIREYLDVIELRLRQSLKDALEGKKKLTPTGKGVRLSVFPEVPQFKYDLKFINQRMSEKPLGPVDSGYSNDPVYDLDDNGTRVMQGPYLPGDRIEGPSQQKGGQGDGDGDGEDGDPSDGEGDQDGDADDGDGQSDNGSSDQPPKPSPGGRGQNPSDIEVPLKLYGELLKDIIELPNIRRTEGKETKQESIRRGKVQKSSGEILWDETMIKAIDKARAFRKSQGLPYDSSVPMQELLREALRFLDPSDYVVADQMKIPLPDFDAVIVINVDMTGSMGLEGRIQTAKNLVFNIKAMLSTAYKHVVIKYVGFDETAQEMSEKEVFSKFKGGLTSYASAIRKDQEILEGFPNSRYNKYILTIGDGETSDGDEYASVLREMKDDLQYAGLAITNKNLNWAQDLIAPLIDLKKEWPWVGITALADESEIIRALKELFPVGKVKSDE